MEDNKNLAIHELKPPAGVLARMRCVRFGTIFTNMCCASVCFLLLASLALIVVPVVQTILMLLSFCAIICMVIFTLGLVFLDTNKPLEPILEFSNSVMDFSMASTVQELCVKAIPYLCAIGIASAILAIIFLSVKMQKGNVGKIVAVSILGVLMVLGLILLKAGGAL